MIEKRNILIAACFGALFASAAWGISRNEFPSRARAPLSPVYENAGDTLAGFAVSASSYAWTTVKLSNSKRRGIYIQVISASYGVCLSSFSTIGIACDNSALGVEFSTSVARQDIQMYSEAAIYARTRADGPASVLKGFEFYDSGD